MMTKKVNALFPGFCFNELASYARLNSPVVDSWGRYGMILFEKREFCKLPKLTVNIFGIQSSKLS